MRTGMHACSCASNAILLVRRVCQGCTCGIIAFLLVQQNRLRQLPPLGLFSLVPPVSRFRPPLANLNMASTLDVTLVKEIRKVHLGHL